MNVRLLLAQIVGMALVFGVVLFGAAGTLAWAAGWTYMGLMFGFVGAISAWLARYDPGLLTERMTGIGKADQKGWDKAWFALMQVLFLGWLAAMPLDAVRFGWTRMPRILRLLGAAVLLASFWLFYRTFKENSFLSPAVRVQADRGQTVVSTGPYAVVRHPMYAAAAGYVAGTALVLGSWVGLAAGSLIVLSAAIRAVKEERVLRDELPGYDAYAARVRYRLLPGIW